MSAASSTEFHFLLDRSGSLIAYEEKDTAWAGLLAFSSEELAREFCRTAKVDVSHTASIRADDPESITALIREVKRRTVRFMLLDLDYRTGHCIQIEFEGDLLGARHEHQFSPRTVR